MTKVQVLSVARITDIVTLESAVQVNFGAMVPADDAMRERFTAVEQQPPVGREAAHIVLSLVLPASSVEPYQVGSSWELDRSTSGELTLKRSK